MDTIGGLRYKYDLEKYITSCRNQGYTYEALWEWLVTQESFLDFLRTKIGPIWMKKSIHGQQYFAWQSGVPNEGGTG